MVIFTARKRSLGQGNNFTSVCHSVHRGCVPAPVGCLVPGECLVPGGGLLPWRVPGGDPPTATAAGGTHPTGMHSCHDITFTCTWYCTYVCIKSVAFRWDAICGNILIENIFRDIFLKAVVT